MGWASTRPNLPESGIQPWLGSFDPLVFVYYLITTVYTPYLVYLFLATVFSWEHRIKTPARHYYDLMNATSYGCVLFIFGNYSQTLTWVTVLSFWLTWPCYSLIAEAPFAKESLPTWRQWPMGMYAIFIGAVAIILAFAGYHIHLAIQVPVSGFVGYYLLSLLFPVVLTLLGYCFLRQQTMDLLRLQPAYNWILRLQWRRSAYVTRASYRRTQKLAQAEAAKAAKAQKKLASGTAAAAAAAAVGANNTGTEPSITLELGTSTSVSTAIDTVGGADTPVMMVSNNNSQTGLVALMESQEPVIAAFVPKVIEIYPVAFHPHHWQIFYALAFFTRFEDNVSRVAAGIAMGAYFQGVAAYGYDLLLEE